MNQDNPAKKEVHVPEYYWKAFCYDNNGVTYAWAYIQVTLDFFPEVDQEFRSTKTINATVIQTT